MAIRQGWTAKPYILEPLLHEFYGRARPLDPAVYQLRLGGSRILIVRDLPPEEYSTDDSGPRIIIPDTASKDPCGIGFVVAVGETVGMGTAPHPHGLVCDSPEDLLYKRVVFGMYAGREFRTNIRQRGFECDFWVLTDRDIWMLEVG